VNNEIYRKLPLAVFGRLGKVATAVAASLLVVACSQETEDASTADSNGDNILRSELNRPWPAPVTPTEELPDPAIARSPEEAIKTISMAPGYQMELVAAEPLVQDPILGEFDGDGRLWVLEMRGFAYHEDMQNNWEPISELVVLEDTDGDTVFDKRTVFLDELIMPRAIKVLDKNCALVGAPPNLFHACDTDGDLRADTREIIEDTFDEQGVLEHGANGLYWGMDNTIFVSQWIWSLGMNEDGFHTIPNVDRGQWGVTQDDAGRIFRNVNSNPLHVDYVAAHYYARNPNLIRTTGLYQNLINQDEAEIWPIRPTPGLNRAYRAQATREDGSASYYGGTSSPMIFRGDRLPEEIQGEPLVVDSPTNLVHLLRLEDDGVGNLYADDFYDRGEILASTDERFRPVEMVPSWDGTFYVIDMYRGVSQDYPYQTSYLKNYIEENGLADHKGLGRVYRVVHADYELDTEKPSMSDDTPLELVSHLTPPNGWWRDTAQQLLVQRADEEAVPALRDLVLNSDNEKARLHALWTLDGMQSMGVDGAVNAEMVMSALNDPWWAIRASGIRLAEPWLREGEESMLGSVMDLLEDEHWQVRRQLAASLGELPEDQRFGPLVEVLSLYGNQDQVTVDAVLSGLAGLEEEFLDIWLQQDNPHADVAGMLAGAIAKPKDVDMVENLIDLATNPDLPEEVRARMLHGMAQGLEGADGDVGGGPVAGGRAGGRPPGMRPERPPVIQIDISEAPTELLSILDSAEGRLVEAARYAEATLGWPGKPRPEGRVRTEEEEQLYQMGQQLYSATCAACHGQDGQGTPVGKSLAGAPLVNMGGEVFTAILLQGKEGDMGLMPPQTTLSDEQLAAIITYVRGSFGNTSDPINEIAVGEYRQMLSYRTIPWTEEELIELD
jgi:mono/diheme cytochrome c family protein/HEAT repeat protein